MVRTFALAVLILAGSVRAADPEIKIEFRSCAEATGTFVKGGGCWVLDLKKATTTYEVQVCAGLVVDAGILVAGGQASTMVCATLTIPAELAATAKDKEAWKQVATQKLKAALTDPAQRKAIANAVGKPFQSVRVNEVKEPDPGTSQQVRDAVKKSKPK